MLINGEGYSAEYIKESGTVRLAGVVRLSSTEEYGEIIKLMESALEEHQGTITMDLRELQMLNSSGITMLSKFVISCRNSNHSATIIASESVPWQGKSLKNLQRLMPALTIEMK